MELPLDLTLGQGSFLAVALFAAAFVRGFSGFGFSAIFLILAALVTNPLPLIPIIFTCEILTSLMQIRGIWAHIDWARVRALLLGAGLATIPAVSIMAQLGEQEARFAVSIMVLALSLLLLSGWRLRQETGFAGNTGVGVISGIANSAGVGGLPAAAFMTAQPIAPAIFRATMIVFLTGIDLMALPVMGAHGLVGPDTLIGVVFAFPILGAGVWCGSLFFSAASQTQFRRAIVILLTGLSILNLVRMA